MDEWIPEIHKNVNQQIPMNELSMPVYICCLELNSKWGDVPLEHHSTTPLSIYFQEKTTGTWYIHVDFFLYILSSQYRGYQEHR